MKKGFTLIELLAVIVILAIIALIATPIVLNIISDTKKSAGLRSADFYLDAVEFSIANSTLNNESIADGTYNITETGNICLKHNYAGNKCDEELEVEVKGETPFYGSITVTNGEINDIALVYQNTIVTKDEEGNLIHHNPICTYEDLDNSKTINLSDTVTCETEKFHVMENDGKYITMLTMYNLNVGDNKYPNEETYGIQDEHVYALKDGYTTYGNVAFSITNYWYSGTNFIVDADFESNGRSWPYVYGDYKDVQGNQQNIIYPYVESYEAYLNENSVKSASTTLLSNEQAEDLKANKGNPSWLYNTTYWLGSSGFDARLITYSGDFYSDSSDNWIGIRPVVIISVNEIK